MGMFDIVMVPCPSCGECAEFQSKSGACRLAEFTLEEAPDDVLLDVNRHAPNRCRTCSTFFAVDVQPRALRQAAAPTVDQVREHAWWWNFPVDGKPHVLQLDVEGAQVVRVDAPSFLDPLDWPGDWAPCLPPEATQRPRALAARSIVWVEERR